MGFVNTYASKDDVQLFGLAEVFRRHKPFDKRDLSEIDLNITLDRERRAALLQVEVGREEHANRVTCVLLVAGREFVIRIDQVSENSSQKLSERPFRIDWALARPEPKFSDESERREILDLLKQALRAFGYAGARRQVPDTVVTFQF